ncbi:hypothetical protein QJR36_11630 [Paraclostridium sordellii]
MENNLTFNEISKHLVNDKNPSEYIKGYYQKINLIRTWKISFLILV